MQAEITKKKQMHGIKVTNLKSLHIRTGEQLENYFILMLRAFHVIRLCNYYLPINIINYRFIPPVKMVSTV